MAIITELVSVAIYSVLGIFLMLLGSFIVDLVIPCSFPEEIKKGNKAIGFISAGAYIAIGLIIKVAISGGAVNEVEASIVSGVFSTIFYYALGVIFLVVGYLFLKVINKKYDLNAEVGNGNTAAGIMVFGMFVGLGLVISGVIA
jgi:putative membrane protein